MNNQSFTRIEALLGKDATAKIGEVNVILFGIGGVGSWCAEGLIRSGVKKLTIVDYDNICETNINRQLQAIKSNIGKLKVDELKKRLLLINEDAQISAVNKCYNEESQGEFELSNYDYVLDAIDSISSKVLLIQNTLKSSATLFSSMGAALKVEPSKIETSSIWKTQHCPLAKLIRKKMRRLKIKDHFECVWSPEVLKNDTEFADVNYNGSLVHITAMFGFALSGLVIKNIYIRSNKNEV